MITKVKFLILLPAIAFLLLMLGGLGSMVYSLAAVDASEWFGITQYEKVLSGESTRQFSRIMNAHFVLSRPFNYVERGISYTLTGDLGPSVRAGRDDWMFLLDELSIHPQAAQSEATRLQIVSLVAQQLKEKNVQLQLVVVPDKSRIESAQLGNLRRSEKFAERLSQWVISAQALGLSAVDLTPVLTQVSGDRYYHSDTHWNEYGAEAAAKFIAARLPSPATIWHKPAIVSKDAVRSGDLIRLASLEELPPYLGPKPDFTRLSTVPAVTVDSDDLFGDSALPEIVLIGTSYSLRGNFFPFLQYYAGQQIANLAKDGGYFDGSATAYFSSAAFREHPPKVVVWEIPERMLGTPIKPTEKKWLERLQQGQL